MSALILIFHTVVLAILFFSLAMVVANVACFESLRKGGRFGPGAPLVSILVPARNEARNIETCVRSLLAQDYPNCELLVLDDHSEDGTAGLVRGMGVSETGEGARLLRGASLPVDWTGKGWACHQLSQQARGEFLFFTDAQTSHRRGLL